MKLKTNKLNPDKPRQRPGIIETVPSTSNPDVSYDIRRGRDGVIYCSCPSWLYQRKPGSKRVCKHILTLVDQNKALKAEFHGQILAATEGSPAKPNFRVVDHKHPATPNTASIMTIRGMNRKQLAIVLKAIELRMQELLAQEEEAAGTSEENSVPTPTPVPTPKVKPAKVVTQGSKKKGLGATVQWLTKQGETTGTIVRMDGKFVWVRTPDGVQWKMPAGMVG